jgi:peptidoglycan/xylan/chitin deacetylase (PgdA/CDA1 family)
MSICSLSAAVVAISSDAHADDRQWRPAFGCHIYRDLDEPVPPISPPVEARPSQSRSRTDAQLERVRWASAQRIRGRTKAVVPYPVVAFTFDDGPDYETTPIVLDALDKYLVPATFFVVGWRFAKKNPEREESAAMLDEVIRRGHTIGNHTFHHRRLPELSRRRIGREIDRAERAIKKHLGHRPFLFRAPFGRMSRRARNAIRSRGYTEVGWNIDPRDFRERQPAALAEQVINAVIENEGGVVLLHDTKQWTAEATPLMFELLEQHNCQRMADSKLPIVPASLDFFIRNKDGSARSTDAKLRERLTPQLRHLAKRCNRAASDTAN